MIKYRILGLLWEIQMLFLDNLLFPLAYDKSKRKHLSGVFEILRSHEEETKYMEEKV